MSSIVSKRQVAEQAFSNSHIFYDNESGFTLNFAGFSSVAPDIATLATGKKYKYNVQQAINKIKEIESGKIANQTAVKGESENRAVDHYNLRHVEELVAGKSLKHSIDYWNHVKTEVQKILDGVTLNESNERYTDVIFNGIGGSFLGPLMLVIALKGDNYNFNANLKVRLHFVSNTDPDSFFLIIKKLNLRTTIMVNMSKSGSTAETKGNMDSFNDLLHEAQLGATLGKHNIAITTKNSKFDQYAQQNKFMNIFYMYDETGGRTSVCSAIGMVPCAFAELSFDDFLRGQSHMDVLTRREDALQNPAMLCAILIDLLTREQGRKNMIVLGYSDFLKEFAHYLQQLYMESLGKEYSESGLANPEGQTVFGGVGTGEQHAFMQQVQKGLPDCFVRFVHFLKRKHDFVNQMAGSMGRQLLAFVKGTEDALFQNGKPYMTSTFNTCDMFNLGMMVAFEERVVTILGAFKNLNAYDQPGVQDGKESANVMNNVSKQIEIAIAEQAEKAWKWNGDAQQARKDFKVENAPLWFVDAVLSDIFANIDVANSYTKLAGKVQVQRKFENHHFVYSISSKL